MLAPSLVMGVKPCMFLLQGFCLHMRSDWRKPINNEYNHVSYMIHGFSHDSTDSMANVTLSISLLLSLSFTRYYEMVLWPAGCLARSRTSSWNTFQVCEVKTVNSLEPQMVMPLTFLERSTRDHTQYHTQYHTCVFNFVEHWRLCCVLLDDWLNLRFVVWTALTMQIVLCIHSLWVATALLSVYANGMLWLFALSCKIKRCFFPILPIFFSRKTFKDVY